MSGQNGPGPASDEAARLETALARIARAVARSGHQAVVTAGGGAAMAPLPHEAPAHQAPLHQTPLHPSGDRATSRANGPDTAEIAARLDGLIAELRALLRPQDL